MPHLSVLWRCHGILCFHPFLDCCSLTELLHMLPIPNIIFLDLFLTLRYFPLSWLPGELCLVGPSLVYPSLYMTCQPQSGHRQKCRHYNLQKHAAASPLQCPSTLVFVKHSLCLQAAQKKETEITEKDWKWFKRRQRKEEKYFLPLHNIIILKPPDVLV